MYLQATANRTGEDMNATARDPIEWFSDLIHLEITLWNQIDTKLREDHSLSLAMFWPLYVVGRDPDGTLRVGELAQQLGLTVGGTSKIVDRVEQAGLFQRVPDAADRRASRVGLTETGRRKLAATSETCEAWLSATFGAALDADQQQAMHEFIGRLLDVINGEGPS